MRIKKGDIQVFSISFLDVLSCALGAVIILLVIGIIKKSLLLVTGKVGKL